jgi:type VI secretion system protein ImpH
MKKKIGSIDFKAEVLAGELILSKQAKQIYFDRLGSFKRNFSRDIATIEELPEESTLRINVNREGIYDYLPEEIFHFDTYTTSKKNLEKESNKTKHQKISSQEKQARKFFSPIENEFDSLLISLELEERKLFDSAVLNPFLIKFYESELKSKVLDKEQNRIMINLFPYLYRLKNNHLFFKFALERILKLNIDVEIKKGIRKFKNKKPLALGGTFLGLDSICGEEVILETSEIHVSVNLKDFNNVDKCTKDGSYFKVIQYLKDLIMEASGELVVFYNFELDNKDLIMSDDKIRLGINTFV